MKVNISVRTAHATSPWVNLPTFAHRDVKSVLGAKVLACSVQPMPASCERCAALSSRPARSAQRAATARKGMEDQLDNPYAHRGARLRGVQPDAIRIVASLSVAMGVAWAVASRGRRPHPLRAREGHARGKSVPQPPQSQLALGRIAGGEASLFFSRFVMRLCTITLTRASVRSFSSFPISASISLRTLF